MSEDLIERLLTELADASHEVWMPIRDKLQAQIAEQAREIQRLTSVTEANYSAAIRLIAEKDRQLNIVRSDFEVAKDTHRAAINNFREAIAEQDRQLEFAVEQVKDLEDRIKRGHDLFANVTAEKDREIQRQAGELMLKDQDLRSYARHVERTETDNERLRQAHNGFKILRSALAEIESRCGGPTSERMKQRIDIYDIARVALERIGVPSSPDYVQEFTSEPKQ